VGYIKARTYLEACFCDTSLDIKTMLKGMMLDDSHSPRRASRMRRGHHDRLVSLKSLGHLLVLGHGSRSWRSIVQGIINKRMNRRAPGQSAVEVGIKGTWGPVPCRRCLENQINLDCFPSSPCNVAPGGDLGDAVPCPGFVCYQNMADISDVFAGNLDSEKLKLSPRKRNVSRGSDTSSRAGSSRLRAPALKHRTPSAKSNE
jgi:hypothetical protein